MAILVISFITTAVILLHLTALINSDMSAMKPRTDTSSVNSATLKVEKTGSNFSPSKVYLFSL